MIRINIVFSYNFIFSYLLLRLNLININTIKVINIISIRKRAFNLLIWNTEIKLFIEIKFDKFKIINRKLKLK